MPDGTLFRTVSVNEVQVDLRELLRRITCDKGRVEITDSNGSCDCVLISKEELDSLEQALEILFNTDGVRTIREHIAQLTVAADGEPRPADA